MRDRKRRNAEHKFIKLNREANVEKPKEKSGKRRPWTCTEDQIIRKLVKENGTRQWALIAEKLSTEHTIHGRSGKQCRERWHNHLSPTVSKNPWTCDEEFLLF